VVPDQDVLEITMGTILHEAVASIAQSTKVGVPVDVDALALDAYKKMSDFILVGTEGEIEARTFAKEQGTLVEGLVRGFMRHCWPTLMVLYPSILFIEEEMLYGDEKLIFMARPDLVLADREGNPVYVEVKSTGYKTEQWMASWEKAVQLHATSRAIHATKGLEVERIIVQGLYKGFKSYGKQSSPFCYGYGRSANPPFVQAQMSYEYKQGQKRVPTWEMEGGVKAWVEHMPITVLMNQFPQTPPIFVNEDLVEAFFRQRTFREHEMRLALEMLPTLDEEGKQNVLSFTFPQKFDTCQPAFGHACPYRMLCHGGVTDPLTAHFVPRVPHHALEVELFEKAAKAEEA